MNMTIPRSLLCCLLLALVACGSTRITDAWQEPGFHRHDMNEVLVVGVTSNKTNRILFERGFVSALSARGIHATASYDVLGGDLPDKASVKRFLANSNIDHVFVSEYGGKDVTSERVPESVRTYYTGPYYPTFGGYWSHYDDTQTLTRESYIDTKTQYMLTTSIYAVKTEKLVWAGRSKTFEPGAISVAARELARDIVGSID